MAWGMMDGSCALGSGMSSLGALSSILYFVLLLGLVILVYLWIAKLWKETRRRK